MFLKSFELLESIASLKNKNLFVNRKINNEVEFNIDKNLINIFYANRTYN